MPAASRPRPLIGAVCRPAQYGEFRRGYGGDKEDTRLLVYGIRYIVENYVSRQWTEEDVLRADLFYKCAQSNGGPGAAGAGPPAAVASPGRHACARTHSPQSS